MGLTESLEEEQADYASFDMAITYQGNKISAMLCITEEELLNDKYKDEVIYHFHKILEMQKNTIKHREWNKQCPD